MMDDLTANKGHIPSQSWVGQNGWSTTSAQGSLLNTMSTSQHLSLGSSSNQRSSFNHLQMPNQSCMRDLSSILSRNNTHQSALYKASQDGSNPSSGSLFASAVMPSVSQISPFAQEIPHTSSMLLSANHGKNIPSLSFTQSNQAQHLSLPSTQSPYKASFQPQMTSQGLPNGLQNLPLSLPSCGREQCQWIPSSLGRGAVSESIPGAAAHSNKKQPQEQNITPQAANEKQRLSLLNQRAQLLQQLAELDKALESMPPQDTSESQSHTHNLPPPSMEDSSQCAETKSSDAQQDQLPAATSEKRDPNSGESEDGSDLDDPMNDDPVSDDDFSKLIPDPAGFSSDDSDHSRPSTPADQKPTIPEEEPNKPGSSLSKTPDVGNPIKSRTFSLRKSSKIAVTPTPSSEEKNACLRRNYCLFCSKPITKLSRHFEAIHSDKPEVAVAFQYPKKSKERLKIWNRLINEGNFLHNKNVLKTGKGQLCARKRPKIMGKALDFLHCLYCRGLFLKKCMFRHMRSCPERVKSENQPDLGRKRIAVLCAMEASEDLGLTDGFKNILSVMVYDEVTRAIMDDPIVLQLGEFFFSQHGSDEKRHDYIRQNLRQVARLVLEAQKTSPMKKLEDFFLPSNFPHVVAAVKVLAGYDQESKTYKAPSLAVKLGYNLQKACTIVECNATKRGDESAAESARKFLSVYQAKWTSLISSGALKTLRKKRDKKVPFARDVKRLCLHLEKVHDVAEKQLRDNPSGENYCALSKIVLARLILFNRRCAREVSFVKLKAFMSRKKSSSLSGMDASVSDLERAMCKFFTRIDIRGKCGRTVPIFLKPSFESVLELIVEVREACGVSPQNPYLFGRPNSMSAYHGSECIQRFVKVCGAEYPEALKSKKIREHYAEMLQMMNLDENEANQILGPNNRVQTLRQDTDGHEDTGMQSNERFHQTASWDPKECSSVHHGPSASKKQTHGGTRGNNRTTSQRSVQPDSKGSKSKSIHRTWEEAEVKAVERHMMRFIKKHIVPQKDDCVNCLEAEPEALSTRTWKGVKDYVRNRITALKRTSGSSKASKK